MSIEDVIARSEQSAQLTDRLRFSFAKSHAIDKLRQFALADTAYYILELIQAAIANGATYLDITLRPGLVRVSWLGGGFSPQELRSLFDFLFADKDDLDVADVRQLALGVNALMGLKPIAIAMESGDGTVAGTTRVEVDMARDDVSVGTPTEALNGSFIVARWLAPRSPDRELRVIEERCLTAPIPLLVNDDLMFGYSAIRSPNLFGCRRTVKFDEGDLYGSLGLATTQITRAIKLLTWGTWISSVTHDFHGLPPIGGVVGFDRLRKTADHANIVHDDVYEELWFRLLPYARQLVAGTDALLFDVELLGGVAVTPREVRELGIEVGRLIVLPRGDVQARPRVALARRFQEVLEAPVLLAGKAEFSHLRGMGGTQFTVLTPQLNERTLRFLERPIALPPALPWLASMRSIEVTSEQAQAHAHAPDRVEGCGPGTIEVYTPAAGSGAGHTVVELLVQQRLLAKVELPSLFPGHVVLVSLDNLPIDRLIEAENDRLAKALAEEAMQMAAPQLEAASTEACRSQFLDEQAGRHLRFAAIVRHAIVRLRRVDHGVQLQFALDREELTDLAQHHLVVMASGENVTIDELLQRAAHTEGLVLATARMPAAGDALPAAPHHVVHADEATKFLLRRLVGELSFVDLDTMRPGRTAVLPVTHTLSQLLRFAPRVQHRAQPTVEARQLIYNLTEGVTEPELDQLPLLRTGRGTAYSFEQIRPRLAGGTVHMFDGVPRPFVPLPAASDADGPLAVDCFVFHQLSKLGEVAPVLDVDLDRVTGELLGAVELTEDDLTGVIGFSATPGAELVVWTDRNSGTTQTIQTAFGLLGRVVTQGLDEAHLQARLSHHGVAALQAVVELGMSREARSETALRVMLDYCEQELQARRRPDGTLLFTCFDKEADRLLSLPLVMTQDGTSVSVWSYLRDVATYGGHEVAGRVELGEQNSPVLLQWLQRVVDVPAAPLPERLPELQPERDDVELHELQAWLNELFGQLRLDEQAKFDLRLRTGKYTSELTLINETIYIAAQGPLTQAVITNTGRERTEAVAWWLLGVFAHINALNEPITNDHELQFQARVLDWLG